MRKLLILILIFNCSISISQVVKRKAVSGVVSIQNGGTGAADAGVGMPSMG